MNTLVSVSVLPLRLEAQIKCLPSLVNIGKPSKPSSNVICCSPVPSRLTRNKSKFGLRGFGLFFVAAVGGLLVNVSVTVVGSLYLGIAPVFAKIVGIGTAFLLNFWVNLRIVFRTPRC